MVVSRFILFLASRGQFWRLERHFTNALHPSPTSRIFPRMLFCQVELVELSGELFADFCDCFLCSRQAQSGSDLDLEGLLAGNFPMEPYAYCLNQMSYYEMLRKASTYKAYTGFNTSKVRSHVDQQDWNMTDKHQQSQQLTSEVAVPAIPQFLVNLQASLP